MMIAPNKPNKRPADWVKLVFGFLGYGIGLALCIILGGGLLFTLMFMLLGPLFGDGHGLLHYAALGWWTGLEYFGKVWAIGVSVVLCFMKGHQLNQKNRAKQTSATS